MEPPEGLKVINFRGKTYFIHDEMTWEKLWLYQFDMHHAELPNPYETDRFLNLLEECVWENGKVSQIP